ncbi:MAG: tRNA (adenosine(37)-N6)-threonylcarbamoyltransferase complex ATPase subunit type 1 TsaE [Microbacteriaceae bacterium]|nr:tRNA (adenosine(37)-N6)-threonylcarbamoyltransferase complex ATPase subunit type 1 TsaE [Microbacteriaceae bacterium]
MAELGARIARQMRAGDLVALNGPLGAGKTTLTRGLGEALGIRGTVASPTFVLARTHPSASGGAPLVHVDAYRLGSAAELDDLDIDFAASIVVVEWAEGMLVGVSDSLLELTIERPTGAGIQSTALTDPALTDPALTDPALFDPDDELIEPRRVTIRTSGPRWAAQPFQ